MLNSTPFIMNKKQFMEDVIEFFDTIFASVLTNKLGEIEIRTFRPAGQLFFSSQEEVAEKSWELCNQGIDVYFGVNPRTGKGGKKENVKWLSAFHAEVDYGTDGHKKAPTRLNYDEALSKIQEFRLKPTLIIHTGGGFHCYWVLSNPIEVSAYGIETIEAINKTLSLELGGDAGTQDISRVLRVPGTYNLKIPDNPRPVEMISNSRTKYVFEDLACFIPSEDFKKERSVRKSTSTSLRSKVQDGNREPIDIDNLPISQKIKSLILHGNDGSYPSRSEADMAVITTLVRHGIKEDTIRQIFQTYPIGEKYRSAPSPEKYLEHSIKSAEQFSGLSEEELEDPLFISGSLMKGPKGYQLKVVKFQEYIIKKFKIKILDREKAFCIHNGQCYEHSTEESLNKLCQRELGGHRELFTKSTLNDFIHYTIGEALIDSEKAHQDEINYLTLQNGLYKLDEGKLIPHTPDIYTTNLLPYDYDPTAKCCRFLQFLEEIFMGDREKIEFIQEAVGYAFHKSIPTPAIFFLVGTGNNGKSVFINTISNLVGKNNTSNVSFNKLSQEYYVLDLFQKMINISGETPHGKQFNTDMLKQVVAGDWVTGRRPYMEPMKFRPYAKHYLAMNQAPIITDNSHGMWRRIWLIPFLRTFTEKEMDRNLESKLVLELSGIFNWALEGYNRLRKNGFALKEVPSLKLAKLEYRNDMDTVRAFANEKLMRTGNPGDKFKFSDAYNRYVSFCQAEGKGKDVEEKKMFKKILQELGFKIENSKKDGNQVHIFNVRLLVDQDEE
ncbi:MAG: phage/plasmid primase, P4 family [Deltaproteobacteria bacterium]